MGRSEKHLWRNDVAHSKYSDEKIAADDGTILDTPEHQLALYEARRCDGDGRGSSGEGPSLSSLVERSMGGDWSWKPARYPADPGIVVRAGHIIDRHRSLEAQMPTFRGMRPSAAEEQANARHLRGEPGAKRYDNSACGTTLALAA